MPQNQQLGFQSLSIALSILASATTVGKAPSVKCRQEYREIGTRCYVKFMAIGGRSKDPLGAFSRQQWADQGDGFTSATASGGFESIFEVFDSRPFMIATLMSIMVVLAPGSKISPLGPIMIRRVQSTVLEVLRILTLRLLIRRTSPRHRMVHRPKACQTSP